MNFILGVKKYENFADVINRCSLSGIPNGRVSDFLRSGVIAKQGISGSVFVVLFLHPAVRSPVHHSVAAAAADRRSLI